MKAIFKLILLVVVTTTISALEPMKVAFVYTSGTPTSVRVQLADNTSNSLFVGESYTTGITPNSSGVIVVNVRDHAGSGTTWANFQASSVSTYTTLDIYVNGNLYAQYRLDQLILAQAQNGILDQDGNLTPPENGSGNIGTDELRWNSGYFEGNTVHIGPADGEANTDELSFSYDDATNTATMTVAGTTALTSVNDNVNIPKQATIDGLRVGKGGGEVHNNTALGRGVLFSNTTGYSNTAIGSDVLYFNTTGNNNTGVGSGALLSNSTGNSNTAIGVQVLASNSTGRYNTAVGASSLVSNTTGEGNVALGALSMVFNTTGSDNTAIGQESLVNNTTGIENTAVGKNALQSNTTAAFNSALGFNALRNNTTGTNNTGIGAYSLRNNTTGSGNTATGVNSLRDNTSGNQNTASGHDALLSNTTGSNNVAKGYHSLQLNNTGSNNTAIGSEAMQFNTTGSDNVALGKEAMDFNTTGNNNIAVGTEAMRVNQTGSRNTIVGHSSLYYNTNGNHNAALGYQALVNNSTGLNNTAIGYSAGSSITTGNNNSFVGNNAGNSGSQKVDASNSMALGANTHTTANNQVVIGNAGITETQMRGVTLMDLAGGGTQNIQVDNTGKIITGGGGGGGSSSGTITTSTTNALTPIPTIYTDTGVQFTVEANTTYLVRGFFQEDDGPGDNGQFDGRLLPDGGATIVFVNFINFGGELYNTTSIEFIGKGATNNGTDPERIRGIFRTGNAGTIKFQLRENAGSGNTVDLDAGGEISIIKM